MSKLLVRNALAALALAFPAATMADVTGTLTLNANSTLNLDTGKSVSSGGDLAWDGSHLTPQGTAKAGDLTSLVQMGGQQFYTSIVSQEAAGFGSLLSAAAVTPAANDVLIAKNQRR